MLAELRKLLTPISYSPKVARLVFLVELCQTVRAKCRRAGHTMGRMLRKALKKFWYLHIFFAIALWRLCLLKVDENGPAFTRPLLLFPPENVTIRQTNLILLLLYFCRASVNATSNLGVKTKTSVFLTSCTRLLRSKLLRSPQL